MVRAAKIYRKEDIQQMSKKAVNAGWGLKGSDNYDIWLYLLLETLSTYDWMRMFTVMFSNN